MVVSCDLVTDAPLHRIVDLHRVKDATVTSVLYQRRGEDLAKRPPGMWWRGSENAISLHRLTMVPGPMRYGAPRRGGGLLWPGREHVTAADGAAR